MERGFFMARSVWHRTFMFSDELSTWWGGCVYLKRCCSVSLHERGETDPALPHHRRQWQRREKGHRFPHAGARLEHRHTNALNINHSKFPVYNVLHRYSLKFVGYFNNDDRVTVCLVFCVCTKKQKVCLRDLSSATDGGCLRSKALFKLLLFEEWSQRQTAEENWDQSRGRCSLWKFPCLAGTSG